VPPLPPRAPRTPSRAARVSLRVPRIPSRAARVSLRVPPISLHAWPMSKAPALTPITAGFTSPRVRLVSLHSVARPSHCASALPSRDAHRSPRVADLPSRGGPLFVRRAPRSSHAALHSESPRQSLPSARSLRRVRRSSLSAARDSSRAPRGAVLAPRETLSATRETLSAARETVFAAREALSATRETLCARRDPLFPARPSRCTIRENPVARRDVPREACCAPLQRRLHDPRHDRTPWRSPTDAAQLRAPSRLLLT